MGLSSAGKGIFPVFSDCLNPARTAQVPFSLQLNRQELPAKAGALMLKLLESFPLSLPALPESGALWFPALRQSHHGTVGD